MTLPPPATAILIAALLLTTLAGCAPNDDELVRVCVAERFDELVAAGEGGDELQAAFDQCHAEMEGDRERFLREYGD